jgi:tetratricopeptide (TPR) repeat protein
LRNVRISQTSLNFAFRVALLPIWLGMLVPSLFARQSHPPAAAAPSGASALTADKALALAEQGRCKEALPALRRIVATPGQLESRRLAGIAGLRCTMAIDSMDATLDFARLLQREFANDPEILFVLVHAYTDLSGRVAQDLAQKAPHSVPAQKLNAEALEMQGKWDQAQTQYEDILTKNPSEPGVHYLLGRLLLSKPNGDEAAIQQAKEQFEKELQIDPKNAGAEYILGEMGKQAAQCEEAVPHFTRATKLDPTFGDAYMSLGFCLVMLKKYEEAIPPLQMATRLEAANPATHYNLALAYSRTGKRDEAEKEFAIHRKMTEKAPPDQGSAQ